MKNLSDNTDLPYELLTSLVVSSVYKGEIPKLG
jgi:hypothetical protein